MSVIVNLAGLGLIGLIVWWFWVAKAQSGTITPEGGKDAGRW